jgi:dTDP-4-dehydrorhamnose reductase
MRKPQILIVGHKGNLGQQLMKIFKEFNPTGWDLEDIDITKEQEVIKKITKQKPNIVINSSAYNAVDNCEEEKEFKIAQKINGYGPGYLAKICKKINADLVHYSSDYVFYGDKKEGYDEDVKPNPIQNYGKSKFLGEQEVIKNTSNFYILRVSKLFGEPGISKAAKKSFIDIMLDLAKEKDKLEVVNEEVSCFTYTYDLAIATKNILGFSHPNSKKIYLKKNKSNKHRNKFSKSPFGIYHITNSSPCTWYECAKNLFEFSKKNVKVTPISAASFKRPAPRPAYSVLINNKFNKLRNWEEAAKEYLQV